MKACIAPTEMEEISTTDPMFILSEKGRVELSQNLLLRSYAYDTIRNRTVMNIWGTKTIYREMKIQRMLCITKTQGDKYGFSQNRYLLSVIYITLVMEDEYLIVAENVKK